MITQELLEFIKQQMQAGMSREQVAHTLQANGWTSADVNEAFGHISAPIVPVTPITPVTPVTLVTLATSATSAPTMGSAPDVARSATASAVTPLTASGVTAPLVAITQPVMQPARAGHSFRTPSWWMGLLAVVVSSVIGGIIILSKAPALPMAAALGVPLMLLEMIVLFVASLFAGVVLSVTTRIVRIHDATFWKALVFIAMQMILSLALSFLTAVSVPGIAVFIAGIVLWFILFIIYYQVSFLKSLLAFVLNIIFSVVFMLIIWGILFLVGFSAFKLLMPNMGQVQSLQNSAQDSVTMSFVEAKRTADTAKIKAIMVGLRAQAEIYFYNNKSTYGTRNTVTGACFENGAGSLFADPAMKNLLSEVSETYSYENSPRCQSVGTGTGKTATAWAVTAALPNGGFHCVDSTGAMLSGSAVGVNAGDTGACK